MTLTDLRRYPLKSGQGESVSHATVERWGLAGDRRWAVIDEAGEVITARTAHRLLLVHPELVHDGLALSSPDAPPLHVPVPTGPAHVVADVWGSRVRVVPAGEEADAWFTKILATAARLVYLADPTQRPTNPARTHADDRVSLADGYPLLLTTEESLAALNDWIVAGPRADEGPLPMVRFRPSVVVRGAAAWEEDDWRRIRIGDALFRVVKGCDRCVLTTIDPVTADTGKEPIATLARHRRWAGKTWFGINLVPDNPGASLDVGDEVAVVSAVGPGAGPLR